MSIDQTRSSKTYTRNRNLLLIVFGPCIVVSFFFFFDFADLNTLEGQGTVIREQLSSKRHNHCDIYIRSPDVGFNYEEDPDSCAGGWIPGSKVSFKYVRGRFSGSVFLKSKSLRAID